jgi:hypothetical protein
MVLHACHNGCIILLAYFQPELSRQSWYAGPQAHLPLGWYGAALAGAGLGIVLLLAFRPKYPVKMARV